MLKLILFLIHLILVILERINVAARMILEIYTKLLAASGYNM